MTAEKAEPYRVTVRVDKGEPHVFIVPDVASVEMGWAFIKFLRADGSPALVINASAFIAASPMQGSA